MNDFERSLANQCAVQANLAYAGGLQHVTMLKSVRARIKDMEEQLERKRRLEKLLEENPQIEEIMSLFKDY